MVERSLSFVVWAFVAASCMAWGLRLGSVARPVPSQAVPVGTSVEIAGDWSRLLGSPPPVVQAAAPQVVESSRYKLAGVMAPRPSTRPNAAPSGQGVALISVDGKPPRAFLVGAKVDGDVRLQSVGLRMAALGTAKDGNQIVLELPVLPPAATGNLGPPVMSVPATAVPAGPPMQGGALVPAAVPPAGFLQQGNAPQIGPSQGNPQGPAPGGRPNPSESQ